MNEKPKKDYEYIIVSEIENPDGLKVGMVQLNRPKALNALNIPLLYELTEAYEAFDADDTVGCIVITGSEKAFAAGSDIKEMTEITTVEMYFRDKFAVWDRIRRIKKPIVAAVSGYSLGGGNELVMNSDIIIAAEGAKFGQPEINLGVIPGAGGTQRLTKAIGKVKAMESILTGKMYTAAEMFNAGLITKITPNEKYLEEAISVAKEIANKPAVAVRLAKECILKALDSTIENGIEFERKNFYLLFASEDKVEGMNAFIEKRKPVWKHK
jgi:enoyl-CoA hydratase